MSDTSVIIGVIVVVVLNWFAYGWGWAKGYRTGKRVGPEMERWRQEHQ